MSEWKETKLQEIALINPAERLAKGTKAKKVAMELLQPFTKKIQTYTWEEYKGGVKFRNGDTLVARITPSLENGKTSFVDLLEDDEIGFGSTEFIVLREIEGISDKNYLFYLACSPEFRDVAIASMTGSSGRQRVQTDVVKQHDILLPPLPEQCAIASVLSSLDDKIDLLHRQNQTLEAMAETLFRQWFVEEADEGWEEGYFSNFFHLMMGLSPKGNTYNEDGNGVPLLNGAADYNNGYKARKFTSDPKRINKIGDILFCIRATIGNIEIAKEEFCLGRGVAAISPKEEHFRYFVLLQLKRIINELISNASGSVILGLSKDDINNHPILIPPNELLLKFHKEINPVFLKLENNNNQIRTLTNLRDTLLPKLMSGEVRVNV